MNQDTKVVDWLTEIAREEPALTSLVLFGSRARKDHHDKSDYDIAVTFSDESSFPKWAQYVREHIPTLCGIDIVLINKGSTDPSLVNKIRNEGVTLYEKNGKNEG